MEKIKSLPANQELIKIEEFETKYNISSERLNIQAKSKSINGKDKKKKNIQAELNKQQGKGKEQSYELNKLGPSNKAILEAERLISNMGLQNYKTISPVIYSKDTYNFSLLLS